VVHRSVRRPPLASLASSAGRAVGGDGRAGGVQVGADGEYEALPGEQRERAGAEQNPRARGHLKIQLLCVKIIRSAGPRIEA